MSVKIEGGAVKESKNGKHARRENAPSLEPGPKQKKPTKAERAKMEKEAEQEGAQAAMDIIEADREKSAGKKSKGKPSTELATTKPQDSAFDGYHLTPVGSEEWEQDKSLVIEAGKATFIGVKALARIWEHKTYLKEYATFDECVEALCPFGVRMAYYLINAAKDVELLKSLGETELPQHPTTAIQLQMVPSGDRPGVWETAKEVAKSRGNKTPTVKDVKDAAKASGKAKGKATKPPKVPKIDISGPIAKGEPEEIIRAKANGVIPVDTVIDTTFTEVSGDEGPAEEITDDDYLDKLPIRDQLKVPTRIKFDAEAKFYRAVEKIRQDFIRAILPASKKAHGEANQLGPYSSLLMYVLRRPDPTLWKLCASCEGSGSVTIEGKSEPCTDCKTNGFHV